MPTKTEELFPVLLRPSTDNGLFAGFRSNYYLSVLVEKLPNYQQLPNTIKTNACLPTSTCLKRKLYEQWLFNFVHWPKYYSDSENSSRTCNRRYVLPISTHYATIIVVSHVGAIIGSEVLDKYITRSRETHLGQTIIIPFIVLEGRWLTQQNTIKEFGFIMRCATISCSSDSPFTFTFNTWSISFVFFRFGCSQPIIFIILLVIQRMF